MGLRLPIDSQEINTVRQLVPIISLALTYVLLRKVKGDSLPTVDTDNDQSHI